MSWIVVSTRLYYEYWVPVMMMVVRIRIPYFLFCVLFMMFLSGGNVCSLGMDVDVCTVRYAFDDLIDNIVATQQQMWVV